jgi:hypothetical protein
MVTTASITLGIDLTELPFGGVSSSLDRTQFSRCVWELLFQQRIECPSIRKIAGKICGFVFMNSNFSGISTNYYKLALDNNFEVFDSIEI